MATYLQYYVKPFYIFYCHLKTIQSIFMKFLGEIDIVFSCTYKILTFYTLPTVWLWDGSCSDPSLW